ncbi:MAG: hypothetical protein M1836_001856 [Candelina mexicana]|nr:MAG: hypothetical protein M1836_001856 [Candelina mexicana]
MAYPRRGHRGGRMGGADRYGGSRRDTFSDDSDSSVGNSSLGDSDIAYGRPGGYGGAYARGRYSGGMSPPFRGRPPRDPMFGRAHGREPLSSDGFVIDDSSAVDSSDGRSNPQYDRRGPLGGPGPGRPGNYGHRLTDAGIYGSARGGGGARGGHAPFEGAGRGGYNPFMDPRGQGQPYGNRGPPGFPGRFMGSDSESDIGTSDRSSLGGPPMGGFEGYAGRGGQGGFPSGAMGGAMGLGMGRRMPGYGNPRPGPMDGRLGRDPYGRGAPPRGYATSSDSDSDAGSDSTSAYGRSARRYGGRY